MNLGNYTRRTYIYAPGQRASVEGYAREGVARRLGALGLCTELLVFLFPPGDYLWGYQVPITVEEFHPFTWLGNTLGNLEIEAQAEEGYSLEALQNLMRAWKVAIIDLQWGRESYLWEHISAVMENRTSEVRFSVGPSPNLGLDTDLVF